MTSVDNSPNTPITTVMERGIDKKATAFLKAIAICFMLMTHFLDFQQPGNLITIPIPHYGNIDHIIGGGAALCVAVFAFVNGYGLSASLEGKTLAQSILYLLRKAFVFLLEYWVIVFSLFLPFWMASKGSLSPLVFLGTLIGYGGMHGFAWYVWFYLIVLVTVPLLKLCLPKTLKWWLSLLLAYLPLAIVIIIWTVLDKTDALDAWRGYLCHFMSVAGGVAFYQSGAIVKVRSLLAKARLNHWAFYLVLSILGFIAYGLIRKGLAAPLCVLPIVFLAASLFDGKVTPKPMHFTIVWLARLSMAIWFVHYLFFADYVNQFLPLFDWVSSARIGIIVALLALLICVPISLLYYLLFFAMGKLIGKVKIQKS